jgi:hypothetical protein
MGTAEVSTACGDIRKAHAIYLENIHVICVCVQCEKAFYFRICGSCFFDDGFVFRENSWKFACLGHLVAVSLQ